MNDDETQVLRAARDHLLASGHMKSVAAYQQEGRVLQGVPDAQLAEGYVAAVTAWSLDIDDEERSKQMNAHMGELTLRNIPLPHEHVKEPMALVAKKLADKLAKADPEVFTMLGKKMLESYEADIKKSQ